MIRPLRTLFASSYALGLLAVAALSLLPLAQVPGPDGTDKLAHFGAYAAIALAAGLGFSTRSGRLRAAALAFALGLAFEVVQSVVPNREASAWDVLANASGVAAGLGFAAALSWLAARAGPAAPRYRHIALQEGGHPMTESNRERRP